MCRILSHEENLFRVETCMGIPEVEAIVAGQYSGASVSMGNPHVVLFCEEFPEDWIEIGAALSVDPGFPNGTNVEFVRIVGPNRIEFRIYERGAGPTLSSGTGSCASAVAAIALRDMPRELHVVSQGGEQIVRWENDVFLTGPAELIARGEAYL
jgi:diaminopimelate epimerase